MKDLPYYIRVAEIKNQVDYNFLMKEKVSTESEIETKIQKLKRKLQRINKELDEAHHIFWLLDYLKSDHIQNKSIKQLSKYETQLKRYLKVKS